jgi:hypothetical protein
MADIHTSPMRTVGHADGDAVSGSSKNFMVCKAPQLGGNEALGAEICAGLWGK